MTTDPFALADQGDQAWMDGHPIDALRLYEQAIQVFERGEAPLCPECFQAQDDWPAFWRGKITAIELSMGEANPLPAPHPLCLRHPPSLPHSARAL